MSWQTCLSNQMTSWRHITTWHCDVVFVQQKRSLFHQEDQLISRIFDSTDNKVGIRYLMECIPSSRHQSSYTSGRSRIFPDGGAPTPEFEFGVKSYCLERSRAKTRWKRNELDGDRVRDVWISRCCSIHRCSYYINIVFLRIFTQCIYHIYIL